MEYIYIYSFFLALVEFYGKWRYINIPYMEAMGVEIVVKIIDQDYNSVPGKGFRILWIWLEKQRSTKESQNTQQEIPDLWSSLLTICWEVTWLTVQSTGAIPNMPIFERSIFQPRWITELQIKRVLKGNRFIAVVSAKDSDPKKNENKHLKRQGIWWSYLLIAKQQTKQHVSCVTAWFQQQLEWFLFFNNGLKQCM